MIDAGYFPMRVDVNPSWLEVTGVREVCSASHHVSSAPDGWVERWLHNEFGWFNRSSDALAVVPTEQGGDYRLFAYRLHPQRFRAGAELGFTWPADASPEPIPGAYRSLGFDSVNKTMESVLGFECSLLSCRTRSLAR